MSLRLPDVVLRLYVRLSSSAEAAAIRASRRAGPVWLLAASLLTALSLVTLPARAQSLEDVDAKLNRYLEAAVRMLESQNPDELRAMITSDPMGAKLCFARALFNVSQLTPSDKAAEAYWVMATLLAAGIEDRLEDPVPNQILAQMGDDHFHPPPLLDHYVAGVATPNRLRSYEDNLRATPGHYRPEAAPSLPLYRKALRFALAKAVKSPTLLVQELDTYGLVFPIVEQEYRKMGLPQVDIDDIFRGLTFQTARAAVETNKRLVLSEFGLEGRREGEIDYPLTSFRIAFRSNRSDLAATALAQARAEIEIRVHDPNPVYRYTAATADYQLRRLRGLEPSPEQAVSEFKKAWSELDSYQPFSDVPQDVTWVEGRMATRFWLQELSRHPSDSRAAVRMLLQRLLLWDQARVQMAGRLFQNNSEDLLVTPNAVGGFLMAAFALADQLTMAAERFPDQFAEAGITIGDLSADIGALIKGTLLLSEELGLNPGGPGFPPFDLTTEGLMPELLGRLALLEARQSERSAATRLELLGKAASFLSRSGSSETVAPYLLEVGREFQAAGSPQQALALWSKAAGVAETVGDVQTTLMASSLTAEELAKQGQWAGAAEYSDLATTQLQEPIALAEPPSVSTPRLTTLAVTAHLRLDQPAAALAAISKSRGVESANLRLAGDDKARSAVKAVADKKRELGLLDAQVASLQAMPASATRDELLQRSQQLLADTRADFLVKSREIRQEYPQLYSSVLKFEPLDLASVQSGLSEDVAVIQYFATEQTLYIFVVTKEAFRLRSVAAGVKELDKQVFAFVRAIRRDQSDDPALAQAGQWLSRALLEPVKADIEGKTTLVLIPSGRLNVLPFAALNYADGKSLLDHAKLIELAKAADLAGLPVASPQPHSVVAFANATGDLPASEREGKEIAELFPTAKVYRGADATRENFLAHGADGDILHLATHGEWNIEDSLQNYLAMADQQRVAQQEIFQLALDNTSLVILSACNTALGDSSGDVKFVASLAEAFWIAGSSSVLASLWAVNDESTAVLMENFYRELKSGVPKAEALRQAQLALRGDPRFSHPYHWSGFVLFGQWR